MMGLKFFGTKSIAQLVRNHFNRRSGLDGLSVVDIPAGKGAISKVLKNRGANVKPYDLFPEFFDVDELACQEANLLDTLPLDPQSVDMVLCQEGIEHIPDQLKMLKEFNRVLKINGRLIITAPNVSNLKSKITHLFTESEHYKRMPPNELDALWFSGQGKMYFGHIFLIGIQRLRVLAVASGFKIKKVHTVRVNTTSFFFFFLYPIIILINGYAYLKNVYKNDQIDENVKKKVYGEIVKLNLHPAILFGGHLFIEFEKEKELEDIHVYVNERVC